MTLHGRGVERWRTAQDITLAAVELIEMARPL